jgi:hypothetical protein
MGKIEKQDARICANLATKNLAVTKAKLKTYLRYLKGTLEFPVKVKGIEDFEWEEYYVFGPGSQREYEQLKKTNPSYTDTFNLLGLVEEVEDWEGILAKLVRLSDKKRFTLPLADLRATDKSSKNYELLDDYSVWFVNNR